MARRVAPRVVTRKPGAAPSAGSTRREKGLVLGQERARQRLPDQRPRLPDAVERDEGAEARPALLAEQHLVDAREPLLRNARAPVRALGLAAEIGEMPPPDLIDDRLQGIGVARSLQRRKLVV